MIVFGCPVTDAQAFERYAEPGFRLAAEPDSELLAQPGSDSISRAYNLMLERVAGREGLEALVLIHQDVEIVDPEFCRKLREALSDPDVALVGCGGAVGVRSIAWWEGSIIWSSYTTRFEELGGGELPGISWSSETTPSYARTGAVDSIDGIVMAMSPWAVSELRFDESLGRLHGYDLDICMQARAAGRTVVAKDLRVVHHHSLDLVGDQEGWIDAHVRVAEKWAAELDPGGEDWPRRARRAEAELEAARLKLRVAEQLVNGLAGEYEGLQRSWSWKLTAPLRALAYLLRRARHPTEPPPHRRGDSAVKPRSSS